MKKHAIIPIFIPHEGCPNDCIFCNQRRITARSAAPGETEVRTTIEAWLSTLSNVETVEIAFYGGSFTGLPPETQAQYLAIAHAYKTAGQIDKIRLSTRPDYIDPATLEWLRAYEVDIVELGVQSFDDEVLAKSKRGHDSAAVYRAVSLLRAHGFSFGIQLMIGLPGDTRETCLFSAREAARLKPDMARLYPTVVLRDTALDDMMRDGRYAPLSQEEAIVRTKAMYEILTEAGITILRVGLKSSELLEGSRGMSSSYHPAFRQLVESRIAHERIEPLLREASRKQAAGPHPNKRCKVTIHTAPSWFSNTIGNRGENRDRFRAEYTALQISYRPDETLPAGTFRLSLTGEAPSQRTR